MDNVWIIIFVVSVVSILHTYVFYPFGMIALFPNSKKYPDSFMTYDELPQVAVLIAAFNEEKVIGEKIRSVFNTNYPLHKLKVYVGSDASIDSTDSIVEELCKRYNNLELVKFKGRVGKINIVNHLQSLGDEEILIMTDANVIFKHDTIYELVKFFKSENTGIVAANIVKESLNDEGITVQEKKYLSLENRVKTAESNAFNCIMGAEGGCYAIRNSLFSKVPSRFIVDDFYMTLQVILKGYHTVFNPKALCSEDVPGSSDGEYRRKVRISSGNFQNLFFFKGILFKFWKPAGFTFLSHKVLRWLTPFFLISALLASFLLIHKLVFLILFSLQVIGFLFPVFNHFLGFKNSILKFISHFYLMNFALLHGFINFTKGIESSIWQPVKRNV